MRKLRKSKTVTAYKNRLWQVFSEYIRKKNADHAGMVTCVTCGAVKHWKEIQAGHYHAKSHGMSLYFDERNVHPQCAGCNLFKSGNLTAYALFLQKTYGPKILKVLDEKRREFLKIPRDRYLELIAEYQEKSAQYKMPEAARMP